LDKFGLNLRPPASLLAHHLSPTPERINIQTFWMTCFALGFGRGGVLVPRKKKSEHKKKQKPTKQTKVLGDRLGDGGRGEGSPMHFFCVCVFFGR